jgi:hypothetical protein
VAKPALKVVVRISPPEENLTKAQLNELFDGELAKFERHLMERQQSAGMNPDPLSTPERGLLKGFLLYAREKQENET